MNDNIDGITLQRVGLALDGALLRHQAIAANIANASTPGHRPLDIAFDSRLETIRADRGHPSPELPATPRIVARPGDSAVQIDREMALMAANSLQYQALSTGLSRYLSIMASAASDGRH
jgi:flagellar basal-body rod protein FlgB